MSTFSLWLSPCPLISNENSCLLFHVEYSFVGTKAQITFILWSRSRQIKPGRRCRALTLLAGLSHSVADRHSVPNNEPEHEKSHCLATEKFGSLSWCCLLSRWRHISTHWCNTGAFLYFYSHFTRTQLKSLVLPVKCLVGEKLMNSRARRVLSGFWPTSAILHTLCLFPTRMEWQLVTVGTPQYGSDPLTIVELRKKSTKVFLSLSFTLFSLSSKQRINQLYTHTYTRTFSFHLSIQQPVII